MLLLLPHILKHNISRFRSTSRSFYFATGLSVLAWSSYQEQWIANNLSRFPVQPLSLSSTLWSPAMLLSHLQQYSVVWGPLCFCRNLGNLAIHGRCHWARTQLSKDLIEIHSFCDVRCLWLFATKKYICKQYKFAGDQANAMNDIIVILYNMFTCTVWGFYCTCAV